MLSTLRKNKKVFNFAIVPFIIVLSGFIRSICVEVFTVPYAFAPGGATGIAAMVEFATGFPAGWTYLMVNVPLLIFAFIFLNKEFALKTAGAVGIASLSMILMKQFSFPIYENGEPVLAAAASGVLGGVALAMMLKIGGSTGGSDVVATFIQRRFSATNVAWFIYGIDAVIVFISAFVFKNGLTPVLMSLVEMFCLAMITDVISSGFKTALKFEIITREPEALSAELIGKLGRGVTGVPARGMYSNTEKSLLICVIRKSQLSEFYKILQKYPDAFAYVTNTSEVFGMGFSHLKPDGTPTLDPSDAEPPVVRDAEPNDSEKETDHA